eukprot:8049820-Pyramimonas_sp.AAC.1
MEAAKNVERAANLQTEAIRKRVESGRRVGAGELKVAMKMFAKRAASICEDTGDIRTCDLTSWRRD